MAHPGQMAYYDFPPDVDDSNSSAEKAAIIVDENRPYCRTLYEFTGEFENELSFSAGEIIYLLRRFNDEWLEGEVQKSSLRGLFPASFVEIVVPLDELSADDSNVLSPIGVASVLFDFEARFPDELSAKAGDSLNVLELIDLDWARCQNPVSGMSGIMPQGFLHVFLETTISEDASSRRTVSLTEEFPAAKGVPFSTSDWNHNRPAETEIPWPEVSLPPPPRQAPPALPFVQPFDFTLFDDPPHIVPAIQSPPPPRPPPPRIEEPSQKIAMRVAAPAKSATKKSPEYISTAPTSYSNHNSNNKSLLGGNSLLSSQSNQKDKVVQDLLSTEMTYLFDLSTWEECISSSKDLNSADKQTLTNGMPMLKELSQALIDEIKAQKERSPEHQRYGEMFMGLRERFFKTFAFHFRCVEQISAIVENESDQELQRALENCLGDMRKRGSNVFDVPTAIARPIQRCLKYPLYVGELLKNTQINHPDHPKLMESLKQLGNLASKMNECKRRKELIRKYRQEEQLSLGDRLSRINMHTLIKKSNRLKYRIANKTIGFGTVKDSEFDYLIGLLEEAERRVCKLLYCAQLYKKHLEWSIKRHEDAYKGLCPAQDESALQAFATMFRRLDEICRGYLNTFETELLNEGKQLVRSEFTKLIHKRNDKLADYETARATNRNADEVEMRRNEYEALNTQVKAQLPRVIGNINKKIILLVQKTRELDAKFLQRMDHWFLSERPQKVKDLSPNALNFHAHLSAGHKQTLSEMEKISLQLQGIQQQQTIVSKPCGKTDETSLPVTQKKSLKLTKHMSMRSAPRRQQTEKERDALIKICKAQGETQSLRRVVKDYARDGILLRVGDIVLIKEHHRNGFSLCDNAVTAQFVSVDCLGPYEDTFIAPLSLTPQPKSNAQMPFPSNGIDRTVKPFGVGGHSVPERRGSERIRIPQKNISSATSTVQLPTTTTVKNGAEKAVPKKSGADLIDLEENLIDLSSPDSNPPKQIGQAQQQHEPWPNDPSSTAPALFTLVEYEREPMAPRRIISQPPIDSTLAKSSSSSSFSNNRFSVPDPFQQPMVSSSAHRPFSFCASSYANAVVEDPFASTTTTSFSSEKVGGGRHAENGRQKTSPVPEIPSRPHSTIIPLPLPIQQTTVLQEPPTLPVRRAPPPPPKLESPIQSTSARGAGEWMECIYDFLPGPNDSNQMSVREGDVVLVQRKFDDAGNAEWWLVKAKNGGESGYVPATYLSPAK